MSKTLDYDLVVGSNKKKMGEAEGVYGFNLTLVVLVPSKNGLRIKVSLNTLRSLFKLHL